MRTAFEQLRITQDIHETQLAEIVESTRRYADKLTHQRASTDRQEVMLAKLYSRFLPYQGWLLDIFNRFILAEFLPIRVYNCNFEKQRVLVYGGLRNDGLRPSLYRLCLSYQILT
ncbi:hypothetical protein M9H77_02921 [Catharanthus roseus]|uniref:Uncharacterized protein n=1 Tax=Catharanthus roseus TaxID=4058 RepID=A0ACC0CA69_CATRO|nr:hypothetical protein M9H77_02921 [Catharanthus roseus]